MKKNFKNKMCRMTAVAVTLCMTLGMVAGCGAENTPANGETNISAVTTETQTTETVATSETTAPVATEEPAATAEPTTAPVQATLPELTETSVYSGTPDTSWFTGSEAEYTLTTADQLMGFQQLRVDGNTFEGVTIKLAANMTINEGTVEDLKANAETTYKWAGIPSTTEFLGTFDGQGAVISGVHMQLASAAKKGMFGTLGENAAIKNLVLDNSYFVGPTEADKVDFGAIAGGVTGKNVVISNVINNAVIEAGTGANLGNVGGFIGGITAEVSVTFENCAFGGSVTTNGENAGGFIGYLSFSKAEIIMNNCKNEGTITAAANAGDFIGWAKKYTTLTTEGCTGLGTLIGKDGNE